MEVHFKPEEEHLPYILASAIWHYIQYTEELVNTSQDQDVIKRYLKIQRLLKEEISEAVKKPIPAEKFEVLCKTRDTAQLLTEILHHYLDETKEILQTIEDPGITQRCLKDIEIIENQLITAIHLL